MNINFLNYYVTEYSVLQNCFHCDKLENVLETNIGIIEDKTINDYKIIGIFATMDEALRYAKKMSKFKRKEVNANEEIISNLLDQIQQLLK